MPQGRRDDVLQQQLRERIRRLRARALLSNQGLQEALGRKGWQRQLERVLHARARRLSIELLEALDQVFKDKLPDYPSGALVRQARGGGPTQLDAFLDGDGVKPQPNDHAAATGANSAPPVIPDAGEGARTQLEADHEPSLRAVEPDPDADKSVEPSSGTDLTGSDPRGVAPPTGVEGLPQHSRRRLVLIATASTDAVMATLGAGYWWWLHPGSEHVVATVSCASGSDVQGVWVRTRSDRLSGWAELSRRGTSSTSIRARIPDGEPYRVHVGCTGTGNVWLDNRSGYVTGTGHTFTCLDDEQWVTKPPFYGPCRADAA